MTAKLLVLLVGLVLSLAQPANTAELSPAEDIPLGAATSRIDYQSIDDGARRLFIAKMGAGSLLVVDLAQHRLIAELPGFRLASSPMASPMIRASGACSFPTSSGPH